MRFEFKVENAARETLVPWRAFTCRKVVTAQGISTEYPDPAMIIFLRSRANSWARRDGVWHRESYKSTPAESAKFMADMDRIMGNITVRETDTM